MVYRKRKGEVWTAEQLAHQANKHEGLSGIQLHVLIAIVANLEKIAISQEELVHVANKLANKD